MHDRPEPWDARATYVVGHQRPDTDAIAAALGYAWYLSALGQTAVVAARAGHVGPQAAFALERFGQDPPRLLLDVAPTFGHAAAPEEGVAPEDPLTVAMARLSTGVRVTPIVDAARRPLGVVMPMALARAFAAGAGARGLVCRDAAEPAPTFATRERISDHRSALLRRGADDFIVTDEEGRYLGMATRSGILAPPRARLILVDHNELSQAVASAEEAEIAAVLDHHRLGNPPTASPIPFLVEPVGSTCTLVAEQCRRSALDPPPGVAGMLLSGVLSDTLVFRSPTTTDRDHRAAEWLQQCVGRDLAGFGEELLRAAPGLAAREPQEIVNADRKSYEMSGRSVSIAQVEVATLVEIPPCRDELLAALEDLREREAQALVCLMVTDVVAGCSRLLCRGERRLVAALPFARAGDGEFDLAGIVSRKKQLVPALYAAIEDAG
jgi:manganese-dependent inorganic pyrophosphatase